MIRSAAAASASSAASHSRHMFRECFGSRNPRTTKFSKRTCQDIMSSIRNAAFFGTSATMAKIPESYVANVNGVKSYQKNNRWVMAIAVSVTAAVAALSRQDLQKRTKLDDDNNSCDKVYPLATAIAHGGTYVHNNHNGINSKSHPSLSKLDSTAMKTKESIAGESDIDRSLGLRELHNSLQQHHERQKVKLGRLLHEFHLLAEEALAAEESAESNNQSSKEKEVLSNDANATVDGAKYLYGGGYIPIKEQDLTKLTPVAAWDYINRLKEGGVFTREDLKRIALTVSDVLKKEPTLIDLRDREDELKTVTVVGDLHGHFTSLFHVLKLVQGDGATVGMPFDGTGAVVFNGDFVDRGENSLEVMLSLLLLKLAYPNHVYLNRGNHEDSYLSTVYGYSEELEVLYGYAGSIDDIWEALSDVFAALPLCVRTNHSAIMHGGIPSENFQLSELEQITSEQRFKIRSTLEPGDDKVCKLVQNVLWSDPRPENGIAPNEDRGAGMRFGPDIVQKFLSDNNVRHLVRSHEPVDAGYEKLEISDEHSAVTVFSAASYPNGQGFNWGAIIRLHSDGSLEPAQFEDDRPSMKDDEKRTFKALAELIFENHIQLEEEFSCLAQKNEHRRKLQSAFTSPKQNKSHADDAAAYSNMITRDQWADAMSYVLDLQKLDWKSLQPYLAPTTVVTDKSANDGNAPRKTRDTGMIDYRRFLSLHCNIVFGGSDGTQHIDADTAKVLHRNHAALLTVFKFLDTDRNGCIDRTEFRKGISLLAKRLPDASHLSDPDTLFDTLDVDGNGTIELAEFEKAFQSVEMPYAVAVIKLFDEDHSGTIDREEFRNGLRIINSRLPKAEQIKDSDALFDKLDLDGNGEIELEEFRSVVDQIHW